MSENQDAAAAILSEMKELRELLLDIRERQIAANSRPTSVNNVLPARTAQRCPLCLGEGGQCYTTGASMTVPGYGGNQVYTTICRGCNGSGIVWG